MVPEIHLLFVLVITTKKQKENNMFGTKKEEIKEKIEKKPTSKENK